MIKAEERKIVLEARRLLLLVLYFSPKVHVAQPVFVGVLVTNVSLEREEARLLLIRLLLPC